MFFFSLLGGGSFLFSFEYLDNVLLLAMHFFANVGEVGKDRLLCSLAKDLGRDHSILALGAILGVGSADQAEGTVVFNRSPLATVFPFFFFFFFKYRASNSS